MDDDVLCAQGLSKSFGGVRATRDVSICFRKKELHALIGPNGAGKTTLINQLQGFIKPDSGQIFLNGNDISHEAVFRRALLGIARSFQVTSTISTFTALQNVSFVVQARLGHSFRFLRSTSHDPALIRPSLEALEFVGLKDRANIESRYLSHGERRQLEIAMALAMNPCVMLLDEPLAGMGQAEGARIIQLLRQMKGDYCIVMVEHDMDAVFAVADRISVLVNGGLIATDAPEGIRANAEVQDAYLGHG